MPAPFRSRRLLSVAVIVGVLAAAVFLGARFLGDEPEQRREALVEFIERADVDLIRPVGEVRSKGDAPYFVGTGLLDGNRPEGVAHVEKTLAAAGWDMVESTATDFFLGHRVRAQRRDMVISVSVGHSQPRDGRAATYPRREDEVWVQAAVGRAGSNQAWTQVDGDE